MLQLLQLYGSTESILRAKAMIENLPQVRQIFPERKPGGLKLLVSVRLSEYDWIAVLSKSGITGFSLLNP